MNFNFHNDSIRKTLRKRGATDQDLMDIETFVSFAHLANGIFRDMNRDFARIGVSQGRIIVLSVLLSHAPHDMTPSELADEADVTRGTMTGLIDGLERDGMIERIAHSSDKRMITIRLKEKGRDFLSQVIPYYRNLIQTMLSEFTLEDHQLMRGLLDKMKRGFEACEAQPSFTIQEPKQSSCQDDGEG
ncbi:MarR family winged helix-turn-helix transcriptional regulator [Paenibacillus massiliensis]|uniref:MarR family winged helix-turn-helix transcriptional regulator n=1 Tax=Paenibacillus massiliensis TaxID=225917 RepID=UPI000410BE1E|nr:MarR family transcriptional regulator [Paenibacillus massiliensis]